MKKLLAVLAVALFSCLGFNAAAQDSVISSGFNLNASGWQSITGPSPGYGELNFGTSMRSFTQNATGNLSLGSTPSVNSSMGIGAGGGTANVGFNLTSSVNGMTGLIAPAQPPLGDSPGWQGTSVNMYKAFSGFAGSSGNGSAGIAIGVESWGGSTFVPPVPVKLPEISGKG